jgi:Zn-dependent protease with chaperone function
MKKILLIFLILAFQFPILNPFTAAAQPLRSQGPLPDDLRLSIKQLYDSDIWRAEQYVGKRVRNKQQILNASYHINRLLAGGHIVYGDPLSTLASRIADTLLKDYPILRSELRFYTVTTPDVNAFTTPQGMIFINTGLMAQLENEAQLAFIIAHEIIHYYRAHGMETLTGTRNKNKAKDLDDVAELNAGSLPIHARSREMEFEADSLGIALFYAASPYWKGVTESVFDILQYSDLPFDDLPFDTTFFNTPYYRLRGCWLDSTADITTRDNYDDSQLTHPNIVSRRQRSEHALAHLPQGVKYLMSTPDQFAQLRHTARMECIRQDLLHGHFARAFYNSWILLRTSPNDEPLNLYTAQALYSIAVAKCNEQEYTVADDYLRVEGESQQVHYALHTMTAEQTTLAALHKVWESHMKYPDNQHLNAMALHLIDLLRNPLGKSATDFLLTVNTDTLDSDKTKELQDTSTSKLTKYERIRQKRRQQTLRNTSSYALTDLTMADSTLVHILRNRLTTSTQNNDTGKSDTVTPTQSKTILFNPTYWVVDGHDNLVTDRSIRHEEWLTGHITNTIEHLGGSTVDFSDQGMHNMTTAEQYNDFLTICEWTNEFWLTKGRFEHHRIMQPAMDSLLMRHNARTLTMTAILNVEGQKKGNIAAYSLLLPFLPVVVSSSLTGLENTTMVSLVVDAHKGTMLTRQARLYKVADHPALIDAMLYDTYVRTFHPSKREPIGFLGRRLGLAAGANFGMSGYQPTKKGTYMAVTPWASVEFVVGRRTSLALTARHHGAYSDITHTYRVPREVHGSYYLVDSLAPGSRNMLTIGFELRRYKNSDFAPLGPYIDFGAHMVRFTTPDGKESGNTFGLHLGLGRNYIFAGRLLLNYQIGYAYTYGIHKVMGFAEDTMPYLHYSDAILSNILTIKVGVGFIPF